MKSRIIIIYISNLKPILNNLSFGQNGSYLQSSKFFFYRCHKKLKYYRVGIYFIQPIITFEKYLVLLK
jgi:hypothetical protein